MKVKRIALLIAVAGLAVLLFGLLTPDTSGDSQGGMNSSSDTERTTYSIDNAVIITIGALVFGAALSFYAFKEDYVPVKGDVPSPTDDAKVVADDVPAVETVTEAPIAGPPQVSGDDRLVLRLLNGDERFMYRTIVDLGGSALQKDLIVRTKMSDAKVSRVIDRLIEKGLVTKERHGVTNRVSISVEK